ncbi:MAG: hypothetical protein A3D57_02485 [Candidatus Sungbacteria bacterium RIFCSPHIGHO2_02_FULL_46_12]|nr:MAG: hypothetical protein A3D57_02485 [Candidatus Sungbacteria bacterium RIFCSPHIGHO2_02_FULL_46_12]
MSLLLPHVDKRFELKTEIAYTHSTKIHSEKSYFPALKTKKMNFILILIEILLPLAVVYGIRVWVIRWLKRKKDRDVSSQKETPA